MIAFLAVGLTPGCRNEVPEDPTAQFGTLIHGDWTLSRAFRNESETKVLDGTYFRFREEQQMETNLPLPGQSPGIALTASYTLQRDSLIMHAPGTGDQLFRIQQLDSQELILSTSILQQAFRFDLRREAQ